MCRGDTCAMVAARQNAFLVCIVLIQEGNVDPLLFNEDQKVLSNICREQYADLAQKLMLISQDKEKYAKTIMTPSGVDNILTSEKNTIISMTNLGTLCTILVQNLQQRLRDIDFDKIKKRKLELKNEVSFSLFFSSLL